MISAVIEVVASQPSGRRDVIMVDNSPLSGELSITARSAPPIRDATADEMRTLGHPLRLRILRLTIDRALTNKEIAERLDRDPGTTLHHVKALVSGGFLVADEPRRGKRGCVERPYRSTGKSWQIRMLPSAGHTATVLDAVRDELLEAGRRRAADDRSTRRQALPDDLAELRRRIHELGDEFEPRNDPQGEPIGFLALVHRRRP